MKLSTKLARLAAKLRAAQPGFTMIELLIVIAILGILAVAVLSAINPIEQINRGRDTGTRSDAEQMLSAIQRFNAFSGHLPWVANPNDDFSLDFQLVTLDDWTYTTPDAETCTVLSRLGTTDSVMENCTETQELSDSFIERISEDNYNKLYAYNRGQTGDATYICFEPQSTAFKTEAQTRCDDGLPADVDPGVAAGLCGDGSLTNSNGDAIDEPMICLP